MKIKNELVSIKIGDKQYDFNNLILDTYLERFAVSQLTLESHSEYSKEKKLSCCLLKFDEPLKNIQSNSEIHNQDFDISWGTVRNTQIITEKQVAIQYSYEGTNDVFDYKENATVTGIKEYYGRKITAIGFNTIWWNDTERTTKYPVCAVLDTSNYNIYLQENQELSITRKDVITTDALFYSSNPKITGPLHLAPVYLTKYVGPVLAENEPPMARYINRVRTKLYSIGLSSYVDYMDKEFVVGQDIQAEQNGAELNMNGIENYLSTDSPLFPSNDIYPGSDLYPIKSNYKYIIFKYQIWEERGGAYDDPFVLTDDYYYQAIPIEKFGKSNLKIKYERG